MVFSFFKNILSKYSIASVIGKKCHFCFAGLDNIVACPACHKIQPITLLSPDPFTLLNQPRIFNLSIPTLHKTLHCLQRLVHPDLKNDGRGCSEVMGHNWSSALNKAYSILKDPITRGVSLI